MKLFLLVYSIRESFIQSRCLGLSCYTCLDVKVYMNLIKDMFILGKKVLFESGVL
jgi:hypothetical protein